MAQKVAPLESDDVATCEIEYSAERALHERYEIDAVPLVMVTGWSARISQSKRAPASASSRYRRTPSATVPANATRPRDRGISGILHPTWTATATGQ